MICTPSEDSDQIRMKKPWVLNYPLSAQRELWSDRADTQADLSLRWAHVILLVLSFCQKKKTEKKKNYKP